MSRENSLLLQPGPALKVSVYLNQDTSAREGFLYQDVLALLKRHGVQGATVYRPYAGYGTHRQLHEQGGGPVAGEHLPVLLLFVDTEDRVRAALPELMAMVTDGLVEMHPVEVLKHVAAEGTAEAL